MIIKSISSNFETIASFSVSKNQFGNKTVWIILIGNSEIKSEKLKPDSYTGFWKLKPKTHRLSEQCQHGCFLGLLRPVYGLVR